MSKHSLPASKSQRGRVHTIIIINCPVNIDKKLKTGEVTKHAQQYTSKGGDPGLEPVSVVLQGQCPWMAVEFITQLSRY